MSKVIYSGSQIKEIEKNQYVEKCTSKQIRFTSECKIEVLKLADAGIFHRDIFHKLGFPEYIVSSKVPGRTYTRWKKIREKDGLVGLIGAKKGRPTKEKIDTTKMTPEEKVLYLEAEVTYLKELHKTAYGHYP